MNRRWKLLVIEHTPMVKRIAASVSRRLPPSTEIDDLVTTGVIALIDLAKKFDKSREVPFGGFAVKRVRGAMLDEVKSKNSAMHYGFQLHEQLRDEAHDDPRPEARAAAALLRPHLQAALRTLTPHERYALMETAQGKTLSEIGEAVGRSTTFAHALVKSARGKMRAQLALCGIDADAA